MWSDRSLPLSKKTTAVAAAVSDGVGATGTAEGTAAAVQKSAEESESELVSAPSQVTPTGLC